MGKGDDSTLNIRPLSDALRKKAEEELNETPGRIEKDLKVLRDWIKEQPHLHKIQASDQWLIAFLRGCKYDMEKAQKKVDMYYTFKSTHPELFGNRDPIDPTIQKILEAGVFLPLRNCATPDSSRICLARVAQTKGLNLRLSDMLKVCMMVIEILLLEDDNLTIVGETSITDLDNLEFRLLLQWTPSLVRSVMSCLMQVLSVRLKSVHIIHPPFGIAPAIALFKMFAGAKLRNRIHNHGHGPEFDSLYSEVGKDILPKELGGSEGTIQDLIDHWKRKVESYRDWFLDENAYSDESKRLNK